MRIVFMGTPDFATACLAKLHESEHEVVGVVTAVDKAAGRGKKLRSSSVKQYALEQDLHLLQPEKLRDELFIDELKSLNADIFVVVAFRMLPEVVWRIPNMGTINLHASLLPNYRGAAPIQWVLINGERKTGMTTFFINDKIDEGDVLLQEEILLSEDDTAGELHDRMLEKAGDLILRTLNGLKDGKLVATAQNAHEGEIKTAPKLFREDGRIDWTLKSREIHNKIRGLSPFPSAWTTLDLDGSAKNLKIYKSILTSSTLRPGEILIEEGRLIIGTADQAIEIVELQLEGKRRMDSASMLRGISNIKSISVLS